MSLGLVSSCPQQPFLFVCVYRIHLADLTPSLNQLPYLDSKGEYLWGGRRVSKIADTEVPHLRADKTHTVRSLTGQSPRFAHDITLMSSCRQAARASQNGHDRHWLSGTHQRPSFIWRWTAICGNENRRVFRHERAGACPESAILVAERKPR